MAVHAARGEHVLPEALGLLDRAVGADVLNSTVSLGLRGTERTEVTFVELTDDDVRWYVGTGEPLDKAGAYAVQGAGGRFVSRVEGSPSNVVGLPLHRVVALLAAAGVRLAELR